MIVWHALRSLFVCLWTIGVIGTGISAVQAAPVATSSPYILRIDLNRPVLSVYHDDKLLRTYPVALGTTASETPIGAFHVVDKQEDWGSGFGTRWLGLDVPWGIYGIHGTNRPKSIGHYESHGCIRLLNRDVEELYNLVPIGTPVIITGNPLKHLRNLEYGNIGADVQLVQQELKQRGYYRGPCDGRFGQGTQFALFYFELSRNLPPDAVVQLPDYKALGLLSSPSKKRSKWQCTEYSILHVQGERI